MKKIFVIALLLSILAAGSASAQHKGWSLGAAFYFGFTQNAPTATGAALCVKFPQVPVMFGFSAVFMDPMIIGVTADWWLFQTHLVGPVELYIGPGLFLRISTASGAQPAFGIRIPVGFQIFIVKAFEIFLEPALAISFLPVFPDFGLQASVGFRFWF